MLVDQFRQALIFGLDYRRRARNLELFHQQLQEYERLRVPRPVSELSAERVLTMEFIDGRSISKISGPTRIKLGHRPPDTDAGALTEEVSELVAARRW